jgi:hypothetical protein
MESINTLQKTRNYSNDSPSEKVLFDSDDTRLYHVQYHSLLELSVAPCLK